MFAVTHHRNLRECLAGISNLPALHKTRKDFFCAVAEFGIDFRL